MQKVSEEGKKKFKLLNPKSKSQKHYQTITRFQPKEVPKVKRKSVSLYKIDYTKEYALPLDKNKEIKFQFWGCAHPPKKIKVRNPFLKEDNSKDRILTGQGNNLLKHYLYRKISQDRKTVLINPQHKLVKDFSPEPFQNQKIKSMRQIEARNSKTLQLLSPYKNDALDSRFFMSTMITDCEDSFAQTTSEKFRPLKDTVFIEKMQELNERITQKNHLLGQIKSNMNMIRFKKMSLADFQ